MKLLSVALLCSVCAAPAVSGDFDAAARAAAAAAGAPRYISERISRGDSALVDEEDAPDAAKSCAVDVSEAVESEDDDGEEGDYSASCELHNGRGVGFITVRRISGRVFFWDW